MPPFFNNMEFQVLDWKAEDLQIDINEDEDEEPEIIRRYIIKCFGLTEKRETVGLTITDFTPYFFIKPTHNIIPGELKRLENFLIKKLPDSLQSSIHSVKQLNKKDMWGFNDNKSFSFIRITFNNIMAMKLCTKYLSSAVYIGKRSLKYKLYESNIEPFIRFLHCKNINPSGWIRVDPNKCTTNKIAKSNCNYDMSIKWKNVESIHAKETICPLIVASFDIECTSSHGDFPLAIKRYEKTTRELIQASKIVKEKNPKQAKIFIKDCLSHIFNVEHNLEISRFFTKVNFKNPKVKVKKNVIASIIDSVYDILMTDVSYHRPISELYECEDEFTRFKKAFNTKQNITNDDKPSEPKFAQLNALLSENFPDVEGDSIIQIGTTFHKYGSTDCYFKHIITLDSCDEIAGVDEVISCGTEKEVLLEWTKLIQRFDPDIMTGYNIFGFDFQFMYDRSIEIGCSREFCKLGRYKNHSSSIIHKCLSSSALGDNFLHYIDMEGRVLIDLMKVIQRDHNLDSYKLDNVASHFIQGSIKSIEGNMIKVDNLLGIQELSLIHI